MKSIFELNRRFLKPKPGFDSIDVEYLHGLKALKAWPQLLELPRVVILAEARAGKTTEFRLQAHRLVAKGHAAFYVTLQDVATDGLVNAVDVAERRAADDWLASDQHAYWFVDSIDEARLAQIDVERALRKISAALARAHHRTSVFLSCRFSDWDSELDFEAVTRQLLPPPQPAPIPTREQLLGHILHHDKLPEPPAVDEVHVFRMAPLYRAQVEDFARQSSVQDVASFIDALDRQNLWQFASRPTDLEWLITRWKLNMPLDSYTDLLTQSFEERLHEQNSVRDRRDTISLEASKNALMRLGAELVFGYKTAVSLPIEGNQAGPDCLDIRNALPEWKRADLQQLADRAVFAPATFGRLRLHADNEGTIRAFLAARWLQQRLAAGCSRIAVNDLLFSRTYGEGLVKPFAEETAAWLANWDSEIFKQVLRRNPVLIINGGDPGSLSLSDRIDALNEFAQRLSSGDDVFRLLNADRLRRFVTPGLEDSIKSCWQRYGTNADVRSILLRLIILGKLVGCAALIEGYIDGNPDESTSIWMGRAIAAVSDDAAQRDYAQSILSRRKELRESVLWDAVDLFVPKYLSVSDFMSIADDCSGENFRHVRYYSGSYAAKFSSDADLRALIQSIVDRATALPADDSKLRGDFSEAWSATVLQASSMLLQISPVSEMPDEVIRGIVFDAETRAYRSSSSEGRNELNAHCMNSNERKSKLFWGLRHGMRDHAIAGGRAISTWLQMHWAGWPGEPVLSDLDWLSTDFQIHSDPTERQLIIDVMLRFWRVHDSAPEVLARIRELVQSDPASVAFFEAALHCAPMSNSFQSQEAEIERHRAEIKRVQDVSSADWLKYVDELRDNPTALRQASVGEVDGRLFALWTLAYEVCAERNQYEVRSLDRIEPLFGAALNTEVATALSRLWREREPIMRSSRQVHDWGLGDRRDHAGISGLGLEAARDGDWARKIGPVLALRAAKYATLELNGVPHYVASLAQTHPAAVSAAFVDEMKALLLMRAEGHNAILNALSSAPVELLEVLQHELLDLLSAPELLQGINLEVVITSLAKVRLLDTNRAIAVVQNALQNLTDVDQVGWYLTLLFHLAPPAALVALKKRLEKGNPTLVQALMPRLFGSSFRNADIPRLDWPFDVLKELIEVGYQSVRIEDDVPRENGKMFSPDDRDHGERGRDLAFRALSDTPGPATYYALHEFISSGTVPHSADILRKLAHGRALADSVPSAWEAGDAKLFEEVWEHVPRTPDELVQLAMHRFAEIEHDLLHADFAQGGVVRSLAPEAEVQRWVADRMKILGRATYSVVRESHVVHEKEPDITLTAKIATTVQVPIEVKVAHSWSLKELEEALRDQLCGKYLQSQEAKSGILLLVYQESRALGWYSESLAKYLDYAELLAHLRGMALAIERFRPGSPRPTVASIDVSSIPAANREASAEQNGS